jgi:hypothetical protein
MVHREGGVRSGSRTGQSAASPGRGTTVTSHVLSVVLPTRDRPELLERAARSVLDQDGVEIELVIVDDASSGPTGEVATRLDEDPRVRVVTNAASMGPGGSRNRGIAVARGDLLGFCDDDDTWLEGTGRAVVDRLDADPGLGVVTSWHRVVHDASGRTSVYRGPLRYGAPELLWYNFVALPFGVVRRSLFDADLAIDTSLPSCEDWDLWLRCAQTRPIGTLARVLYAYHQHGADRVTRVGSGDVVGRRRFLDKHAASMSAACRRYHELVVAQLGDGRAGVLEELGGQLRTPGAALLAGSVLAVGAVASGIGTRRHDPGLPARVTASLLRPVTGSTRSHHGAEVRR